jgi:hypothetical protein
MPIRKRPKREMILALKHIKFRLPKFIGRFDTNLKSGYDYPAWGGTYFTWRS